MKNYRCFTSSQMSLHWVTGHVEVIYTLLPPYQFVQRLATDCTGWRSNSSGGEIFPTSLLCNVYRCQPGVKTVGAWRQIATPI